MNPKTENAESAAQADFVAICYLVEPPCFALPLFINRREGNQLLSQIIDESGRVTGLFAVDVPDSALEWGDFNASQGVGDEALWVFARTRGDFLFGKRGELKSKIKAHGYYSNVGRPFLKLEIAEFLEEAELRKEALREVHSFWEQQSPAWAQAWRDYVLLLPEMRRALANIVRKSGGQRHLLELVDQVQLVSGTNSLTFTSPEELSVLIDDNEDLARAEMQSVHKLLTELSDTSPNFAFFAQTEEAKGRQIILAQPRGFCAGAVRAIDMVEKAIDKMGKPIYVRHPIVHNNLIIQKLEAKGAVFVDELSEVPKGSTVVFSGHGAPPVVFDEARSSELHVLDGTCPLISKIHKQAKRYRAQGRKVIVIGDAQHPETIGILGHCGNDGLLIRYESDVGMLDLRSDQPLAYVTQSTLNSEELKGIIVALKRRFSNLLGPETSDICYAVQNRQDAVRKLAEVSDVVIVVGSANSANSARMREVAIEEGVPSYLADDGNSIDPKWIARKKFVGVTAGASTSEESVRIVIDALQKFGTFEVVQLEGKKEHIEFRLPPELRT